MVRATLKQSSELQRKRHVPESDRTTSRDDVADWIENKFVDGDEDWQSWTISDIANDIGCSRQHVADTLDAYFDPYQEDRGALGQLATAGLDESSGQGYQDGYRDGFEAGVRFALEESDLLQELLNE